MGNLKNDINGCDNNLQEVFESIRPLPPGDALQYLHIPQILCVNKSCVTTQFQDIFSHHKARIIQLNWYPPPLYSSEMPQIQVFQSPIKIWIFIIFRDIVYVWLSEHKSKGAEPRYYISQNIDSTICLQSQEIRKMFCSSFMAKAKGISPYPSNQKG